MRNMIKRALIACALLAAPVVAMAAEGFATTNVNLRSGPSTAYPAVIVVRAGAPLNVYGCLADTPWCDVSFRGIRGWMAGRYIQTVYRQRRVYVAPEYYRPLGIPVIRFDLDRYWDRNYRSRDFYRDRDRWRREYRPRDFNDNGYESDRERLIRRRAERSWNDDNNNGWNNDDNGGDFRRDDRNRERRWNQDQQDDFGNPGRNRRDDRNRQPQPQPVEPPPPQPQPQFEQPQMDNGGGEAQPPRVIRPRRHDCTTDTDC